MVQLCHTKYWTLIHSSWIKQTNYYSQIYCFELLCTDLRIQTHNGLLQGEKRRNNC